MGLGGGIAERGTRTVGAFDADNVDGTGVGLRMPGNGDGLCITLGGGGVKRPSTFGPSGGVRLPVLADGGDGVWRLSVGGIVDLRDEVGAPEGGNGVVRFSGGGMVEYLRVDAGSTVARAAPDSSSDPSKVSPLRGSTADTFVEERRDELFAELCGAGTSGGVFPIVTELTLVEFSQRVIPSLHPPPISLPVDYHASLFPTVPGRPEIHKSIWYSLIL